YHQAAGLDIHVGAVVEGGGDNRGAGVHLLFDQALVGQNAARVEALLEEHAEVVDAAGALQIEGAGRRIEQGRRAFDEQAATARDLHGALVDEGDKTRGRGPKAGKPDGTGAAAGQSQGAVVDDVRGGAVT